VSNFSFPVPCSLFPVRLFPVLLLLTQYLSMPDNTQRFTGRAEDYDRYRQRYPTAEVSASPSLVCGLTPTG